MAKSYSEELADWVKHRPSTRRDKNVVAFLAVRADVEEALEKGYPVSTIWAHMYEKKRVAFRYEMFLHYVNRYVRRPKEKQAGLAAAERLGNTDSVKATQPKPAKGRPGPVAMSERTLGPATFTFNAAPDQEELL